MARNPVEELIKGGALVIDVRSMEEFEEEHYPNAICIPVNEILSRLSEVGPKDRQIVLYCASGARSALAARMLKSAGYSKVVNAGGLYDMPNF